MSREIIFRGRDITTKQWHYGDLLQYNDGSVRIGVRSETFTDDGYQNPDYKTVVGVDEETIGQFTGIHDMNVNDIYEGDIIRSVRFKDIILLVVYDEKKGAFMAVQINKNRGTDLETRCHITQEWLDNFPKEVIGNMYDNPKLLED